MTEEGRFIAAMVPVVCAVIAAAIVGWFFFQTSREERASVGGPREDDRSIPTRTR